MKKILIYVLMVLFVYSSPMADCTVVVGQGVAGGGCTNLVSNGDFATNDLTDWANNSQADASTGAAVLTNVGGYAYIRATVDLADGVTYDYSFVITGISGTAGDMQMQHNFVEEVNFGTNGNDSYTGTIVGVDGEDTIRFIINNGTADQTFTVDNVQVCAQ